MSTSELGYCTPGEIKIQRAGKGKMIMKENLTKEEVSEAQDGDLSLEEEHWAPSLCQSKGLVLLAL